MHCGALKLGGLVLAIHTALLPQWCHHAALVAATASTAASGAAGAGTGAAGESLMEKYTFRETIKTVIEEEHLPELPQFLESIGLGDRLEDFYRKSVFETKYLFTVNDMDLRLIGLSPEDMRKVKDAAKELKVETIVTEERVHPLLARRNELTYGRLFLERSASSFEFYLAGFGPPPPSTKPVLFGQSPVMPAALLRKPTCPELLFSWRGGRCSFVEKANNMATSNATAMVVINNGNEGEELFRVAATLGGVVGEEEPKGPEHMATVLVRGSALPSLSKALEWGAVTGKLVPLDCKPGKASCEAVLPEEREADTQVDSGILFVSASTSIARGKAVPDIQEEFEFLSATFGATLPRRGALVVPAFPEDACTPLENSARITSIDISKGGGTAVLVRRGCSFGVKAKHVQDAGGRVVIVADNSLGVLQNVGAPDPLAKELYIPGVFITERAGDVIAIAFLNHHGQDDGGGGVNNSGAAAEVGVTVHFEPDNSVGRAWAALGATRWPAGVLETRVMARQLQGHMHTALVDLNGSQTRCSRYKARS